MFNPNLDAAHVTMLTEAVEHHWGERCSTYEPGCACCDAWQAIDALNVAAPHSEDVAEYICSECHSAIPQMFHDPKCSRRRKHDV